MAARRRLRKPRSRMRYCSDQSQLFPRKSTCPKSTVSSVKMIVFSVKRYLLGLVKYLPLKVNCFLFQVHFSPLSKLNVSISKSTLHQVEEEETYIFIRNSSLPGSEAHESDLTNSPWRLILKDRSPGGGGARIGQAGRGRGRGREGEGEREATKHTQWLREGGWRSMSFSYAGGVGGRGDLPLSKSIIPLRKINNRLLLERRSRVQD